jgi:hypothetical protein
VTARSVRTGAVLETIQQPGRQLDCSARQICGPQLAPSPSWLKAKCEWKRGDEARTLESGSWDKVACHSLVYDDRASRPPVQATLRLAALGLDWARPRCRTDF